MEYYFEVFTSVRERDHMLVKARDVIEAGTKAANELAKFGYITCERWITEIKRINTTYIID